MTWTAPEGQRRQFMAGEEALAEYLAGVLPRLVSVGATGALLWCYADYAPELWDRPPCRDAQHERFFGLVRPDGSLKPHAQVLRDFAATKPQVLSNPAVRLTLPVTPDAYYADPARHAQSAYAQYLQLR
jgi:endo-1,4-beta-mannosidase